MGDGSGGRRGFLGEPASRYLLSSVVLLWLGLAALGPAVGGVHGLVTGDVRGGRLTGLGLLMFAALALTCSVTVFRRGGRMRHVLVGIGLMLSVPWLDTWVTDPDPQFRVTWSAVVLPAWFAVHWLLFAVRGRREAAGSLASVATVESVDAVAVDRP